MLVWKSANNMIVDGMIGDHVPAFIDCSMAADFQAALERDRHAGRLANYGLLAACAFTHSANPISIQTGRGKHRDTLVKLPHGLWGKNSTAKGERAKGGLAHSHFAVAVLGYFSQNAVRYLEDHVAKEDYMLECFRCWERGPVADRPSFEHCIQAFVDPRIDGEIIDAEEPEEDGFALFYGACMHCLHDGQGKLCSFYNGEFQLLFQSGFGFVCH